MTPTELLRHWRFRIHRVQLAHYEAARLFNRYHILLGFPVIILSIVVGTIVFATRGQFAKEEYSVWLTVMIGLLSITSAVFASLQTFLRYSELAEKHRVAGAKSSGLKHKIEVLGTIPPKNEEEFKTILTQIEAEWEKLREESPNIPTMAWRHVEKNLTFESHEERYPEFADKIASEQQSS